jgi:hypothetical protein
LLLVTAAAMGYYNWRVFGNPLTLPYQINRATYAVASVFVWQPPKPEPLYRHKVMRDFYISRELPVVEKARTFRGFLEGAATKAGIILAFYFGAALMIPLIMLRRVFYDRRTRFLVLTGGLLFAGMFLNAFMIAHYAAPATGLLLAVLVQAMRHLRVWRPGGQPVGAFLVRALPTVCLALCLLHLAWIPAAARPGLPRAKVQQQLERSPGRQLAIVRYAAGHDPMGVEWVYNAADIDRAQVVWAREMTPAKDEELTAYFKDRTVWLVEPDQNPPRVSRIGSGGHCLQQSAVSSQQSAISFQQSAFSHQLSATPALAHR